MSSDEKKPHFRAGRVINYILLGMLAFIIGFYVSRYRSESPVAKRNVSVASEDSPNLALPQQARLGINATFTIPSRPSVTIKSYFVYSVTVTNNGGEPLRGGELYVESPSNVSLIKSPLIKTQPPAMGGGMQLSRESPPSLANIDIWRVGFLKPGEAIRFTYAAYSPVEVGTSHIKAIFKKKGWSVSYSTGDALQDLSARIESVAAAQRHLKLFCILVIILLAIELVMLSVLLFKPSPTQG